MVSCDNGGIRVKPNPGYQSDIAVPMTWKTKESADRLALDSQRAPWQL